MKWKRFNYLVHRWIGIVLGILMLSWFASGIVMMYYPFPVMTGSEKDALLQPFQPSSPVVEFEDAFQSALEDYRTRRHPVASDPANSLAGMRLQTWNGRLVYRVIHQRGYFVKPYLLVDAKTGHVLSPVSPGQAEGAARVAVAEGSPVAGVELLPRGDHYMFFGRYHLEEFPVYRVRFQDSRETYVYVGSETGCVYASADRWARVTTWIGTVPHWFYFMWLYERSQFWFWSIVVTAGVATLISITGIILGLVQLFPWRRNRRWRVSPYRGLSKWHHIAGIVFGLLVFTWTLSGVFEMYGATNDPRAGQAEAVRQGPFRWDRVAVSIDEALDSMQAHRGSAEPLVAMDLMQFLGQPGYRITLTGGEEYWVSAEDGSVRQNLSPEDALRATRVVVGDSVPLTRPQKLFEYDDYYYHRHGREVHLPVWKVATLGGDDRTLYLDLVSGEPTGYVGADTRIWRWMRDGLHSIDLRILREHRPLWDVLVLSLMLGGVVVAFTGLWLALRRLLRLGRRSWGNRRRPY